MSAQDVDPMRVHWEKKLSLREIAAFYEDKLRELKGESNAVKEEMRLLRDEVRQFREQNERIAKQARASLEKFQMDIQQRESDLKSLIGTHSVTVEKIYSKYLRDMKFAARSYSSELDAERDVLAMKGIYNYTQIGEVCEIIKRMAGNPIKYYLAPLDHVHSFMYSYISRFVEFWNIVNSESGPLIGPEWKEKVWRSVLKEGLKCQVRGCKEEFSNNGAVWRHMITDHREFGFYMSKDD